MGSKLKTLSSEELVKFLSSFGFALTSQKGSHLKLHRQTQAGKDTLVIPVRKEIPKGTLKAIFNQASRFIPQNELRKFFYTE